jgi:hypothetical protein
MTNQWVENWLAEIESTSEEKRLQLNRLQADQCLATIAELEQKLADVESLAAEEQMLIEKYRQAESDRITKRIRWLAASLEAFMREHNKAVGDKSLQLPHGQLKLRQQKDRVLVENVELLMPTASAHNLVRIVPESYVIDQMKLLRYVKTTGEIPAGTRLVEGDTKFSYITIKGVNDERTERQQTEVGVESGAERTSQAVEEPNPR